MGETIGELNETVWQAVFTFNPDLQISAI